MPSNLADSFRSLDVAAKNVLNGPFLTFFKEKVSLSKEDISENSVSVNNILPQILDEIRKRDERFALRILNTGDVVFNLKIQPPHRSRTPLTAGSDEGRLYSQATRVKAYFVLRPTQTPNPVKLSCSSLCLSCRLSCMLHSGNKEKKGEILRKHPKG